MAAFLAPLFASLMSSAAPAAAAGTAAATPAAAGATGLAGQGVGQSLMSTVAAPSSGMGWNEYMRSALATQSDPGDKIVSGQPSSGYTMKDGMIADLPNAPAMMGSAPSQMPNFSGHTQTGMSAGTPPPLQTVGLNSLMQMASAAQKDDPFIGMDKGKLMQYLSLMNVR